MIRGALLDSGDVLIGPRGGRWWPPDGFVDVLIRDDPTIDVSQFEGANREALVWFNANHAHTAPTPSEAHDRTRHYYSLILREMGVPRSERLLDSLCDLRTVPTVAPQTRPLLEELRKRGLPVALVTDASRKIREVYSADHLDRFFDAMIISGEVGYSKPDPRSYRVAADALGLPLPDLAFLDNDLENVEGAERVGCQGVLYDPAGAYRGRTKATVSTLLGFVEWIDLQSRCS